MSENNSVVKVEFRENIMKLQNEMISAIDKGNLQSNLEDCTLKHYFTPIQKEYGCGTYAREMFLPKGTVMVGKIHRHHYLNFIMKGKLSVSTEFGKQYYEAPCIFVSEPGMKRAIYAEEDSIWVNVHQSQFTGEENLDKIESEVIAPSYEALGLIASKNELNKLEVGE
jgi:hypothetical protein